MVQNRRKFISSIVAGVTIPLISNIDPFLPVFGEPTFPIRLFSKPLVGMRLIASHIKTLAVKDFTWRTVNGKPEAVTVPLGEGMVNWDLYFRTLKELGISVPITLHIEYPLLEPGEDKLSLIQQQKIITGKLRKDVEFLNSYIKR